MDRILLVNPHETHQEGYTNPPLGILYLAGTLIKHGFNVRVADGCLEGKAAVRKAMEEFKPDWVGITCLTPGRKKALELAEMAKNFDPTTRVVLGGPHATIMHEQIMAHYPFVDLIVLGEGEPACLEIAEGKDPSEIAGVVYRDKGRITKSPPRKPVENLDDLPFPAWGLVDLKKYDPRGRGTVNGIDLEKEPRISVVFSRGCTGRCSFCSTWWIWKGWRHRSATNMVDELKLLNKEFGIKHFCFADDALTIDRQATLDLCDEIIARELNIAFFATTRADCVDEIVLRKMKEAGCYEVTYGIETASPLLLERMGKRCEVEHAEKAIRLTKDAGLIAGALLIIGNVGETSETVAETLDFLKRTQPDFLGYTGGLWILPGTKLYQECRKRGFIDDSFWLGDEPFKVYTLEHSPEELARYEQILLSYRDDRPARIEATAVSPRVPGKRPTFGAVYCVYDDDFWLTTSLESVYDCCDAIWFLVSDAPWNGKPTDNASTLAKISQFPDPDGKVHLVRGRWKTETDQRNAGLQIVRDAGLDYCFVVDADEIFDPVVLRRMMDSAASRPEVDYWHVRMDTYWKSCYYRIEPREPCEPVIFLKTATGSFSDYRRACEDGTHETIPLEIGFYHHMSYARSDELIRRKIMTFSHADEMRAAWFEDVWEGWDSNHSMTNLNPVCPSAYQRAVPQSFGALPPALQRMVEADAREAEAEYARAQQLIENGAYDDAESALANLVDRFPPHALAHNDLGVIHYQKGDTETAIMHLDWAVFLDPADLTTRTNLRDIYLNLGRLDELAGLYERILAGNPDDLDALLQMGHLCGQGGSLSDALAWYSRVLAADPENEEARRRIDMIGTLMGRASSTKRNPTITMPAESVGSEKLRIIAILAVFNEGDIIYHVIRDLVEQDIEVYILDHHSTDNSVAEASKWLGKGLLKIETFPEESGIEIPNNVFSLRYILLRKEQLVRELGPAWYINADTDEFRESPWPGLNLRRGIERVDVQGYNTINFAIYDFKPTDDSFVAGDDVRECLTGYAESRVAWDHMQARCWKHWGQPFQLWQTGGHLVEFEGRRIYPIPFILRHYPIRSQRHGLMKIFNERKNRFDANERAASWHVQYDDIAKEGHSFLHDEKDLVKYDRLDVCRGVFARFGGIEVGADAHERLKSGEERLTSIVILARNQLEYTKKCLESIRRCTDSPYELVIVDNGSTDGTAEYLAGFRASRSKPDACRAVKIVRHEANLGYAAGNNSGMAVSEGAYVCIMNNDIVVTPGWLERLTRLAEYDPRIGIVGPMSNRVSGPQLAQDVSYDQDSLRGLDDFAERWAGEGDLRYETAPRLVGFCMLVKRAVIERIGGFDDGFGIGNYEDDDFCIRAAVAGFRAVIAKDCFVHHFGSRTFSGERINYEALMAENWEVFKQKWGLPADLPLRAPYEIGRLLAHSFDEALHYIPISPDNSEGVFRAGGTWFAAPDWRRSEEWERILEDYVGGGRARDGSLLRLYAGHLTDSTAEDAFERVSAFLKRLDVPEDECPEIEITDDLLNDRATRIILSGSALDEKLLKQFPGRCVDIRRWDKAA